MSAGLKVNALDRALLAVAPKWALSRLRARAQALVMTRHFEAAAPGPRTSGWNRSSTDANMANWGALGILRNNSREAIRNDAWAINGQRIVARNTVGWGMAAKAVGKNAAVAAELWKEWAGENENLSTECDADHRMTFSGLQRLVMESIFSSGEVLVRRRWRRATDGHTIPMQLQVLEADFLDIARTGFAGPAGGPTIQGVEFDQLGKRTAYWLFDQHPGSGILYTPLKSGLVSRRIPAADVLHVYRLDRVGQVRGVPWLAPVLVKLKDFDEWDDATLLRQKIAACITAFVTDPEGEATNLGGKDPAAPLLDMLSPGLIATLPPGKDVVFSNPPTLNDGSFSESQLRKIAAGIGVTYEELSNDYSKVNFSSARMARLAHWGNVADWRWNMLVPQFCARVFAWAMEALLIAGELEDDEVPGAIWTGPAMPMLEPDKEGLALARLVRTGAMTPSQMVREQGLDPDAHWAEYSEDFKKLDAMGIVLDADVRKVSQAGLTQERVGSAPKGGASKSAPEEDPPPPATAG